MRKIFVAAAAALLLFSPRILRAQGTKLWLQSQFQEFEKGQPKNVAISSDGYLEPGPELRSVLLTPSTYLWQVASDRQGNAYLATGSPATVLKVSPDGKSTKLFSTRDLSVQAVAVGPDGSVYAATLPSGKVYRIRPTQSNLDDTSAAVVFDPAKLSPPAAGSTASAATRNTTQGGKAAGAEQTNPEQKTEKPAGGIKYIWDLAFDAQGRLYIATGGPAAIYRVAVETPNVKPELFFSSDEQHIRCLLFEPNGDLIAGSDGAGLVYRIGKDGRGMVIYNAPKREVTALAEGPAGRLYVASAGEKSKSTLPPLPVQGNVSVTATITIVTPGSVRASRNNSVIPEGSEIDELNSAGAPRQLWASSDDVVYALRATPRGLLAATGNRGRIYRIAEDGSYADLARASSGQATGFASASGGIWVATSNTGRLYELSNQPAAQGTYESDVFDAGAFSTWGRAEVNATDGGPSGPFELYARSGNIENPERGWSPWQRVAGNDSRVTAPAARFVQWKAVLSPSARLSSVGINYLPVNLAPVVSEIAVVPGARVNPSVAQPQGPQTVTINLPSQSGTTIVQDDASGTISGVKDRSAVTVRWAAQDANGDRLVYDLYLRADGEKDWRLLKAGLTRTFYSFDAVRIPDGGYRIKVVASDAPSHPAGDAMTGARESEHFIIDTTPPVISLLAAKLDGGKVHIAFQAKDATSPIARAEVSLDAGPWQHIDPVGRLSDSLVEHYDAIVPLPPPAVTSAAEAQPVIDASEHIVTVRAYDRYGNVSAAKTVFHAP